MAARALLFLVLVVLAGCTAPSESDEANSASPPTVASESSNPLIKAVDSSAKFDAPFHMLAPPTLSLTPVPSGEPVATPFPLAVPFLGSALEWSVTVGKVGTVGPGNLTLWVEVPDGAVATPLGLGCDFGLSITFSTDSSISGYSFTCPGQIGPSESGRRRLDWDVAIGGQAVNIGTVVTVQMSSYVVAALGEVLALGGAQGVDSQLNLKGLRALVRDGA